MKIHARIFPQLMLLAILALVQVTPALARNDDLISHDIAAQITETIALQGARIEIHVDQQLVVLTGEVRFYEQKLVSERIAWTTQGVFEVDNEIQVKPRLPLTDEAIERKIGEMIKLHTRFHGADIIVSVNNGVVSLQGSFSATSDPTFLKHQVAEIEGVLDIKTNIRFLI